MGDAVSLDAEGVLRRTGAEGFCHFAGNEQLVLDLCAAMRRKSCTITSTPLSVLTETEAKNNTLSQRHGCSSFPFHTDYAFRAVPPRFILLWNATDTCFERRTYVSRFSSLSPDMIDLLRGCTFGLARFGERYLLNACFTLNGMSGWRWDQDFLVPENSKALQASREVGRALLERSEKFGWAPKSAIFIDNWRCSHARGPSPGNPSDRMRRLIRFEFWTHARMVI